MAKDPRERLRKLLALANDRKDTPEGLAAQKHANALLERLNLTERDVELCELRVERPKKHELEILLLIVPLVGCSLSSQDSTLIVEGDRSEIDRIEYWQTVLQRGSDNYIESYALALVQNVMRSWGLHPYDLSYEVRTTIENRVRREFHEGFLAGATERLVGVSSSDQSPNYDDPQYDEGSTPLKKGFEINDPYGIEDINLEKIMDNEESPQYIQREIDRYPIKNLVTKCSELAFQAGYQRAMQIPMHRAVTGPVQAPEKTTGLLSHLRRLMGKSTPSL